MQDDPHRVAALKTVVAAAVGNETPELLDRAAGEMRQRAKALSRGTHWSSPIENVMGQLDHAKLAPLLVDMADLLSPRTACQSDGSDQP
jgi:hypothetical protein